MVHDTASEAYLLEFGDLLLCEHREDIGAGALGLAASAGGLPLASTSGRGRGRRRGRRRRRLLAGGRVSFLRLLLLYFLVLIRLEEKVNFIEMLALSACYQQSISHLHCWSS